MPKVEQAPERVISQPIPAPEIRQPAFQIKVDSDFSNVANYPQFEMPQQVPFPQPVMYQIPPM
jgi:hypothetical protein